MQWPSVTHESIQIVLNCMSLSVLSLLICVKEDWRGIVYSQNVACPMLIRFSLIYVWCGCVSEKNGKRACTLHIALMPWVILGA